MYEKYSLKYRFNYSNIRHILVIAGITGIILCCLFRNFYVGIVFFSCSLALGLISRKLGLSCRILSTSFLCFSIGTFIAAALYCGYIHDYNMPYWMDGLDDYELEQDAVKCIEKNYYTVYDMLYGNTTREILHNTKGYVIFLSYIMRVGDAFGGYHTMVPRIINIFCLNIIGLLMLYYIKTVEKILDSTATRFYCFITLFPNFLYISSHIYRDTMASLILVLNFILAIRIINRRKVIRSIILMLFIAYFAYWIRAMLVLFIIGIVFMVFFFGVNKKATMSIRKVVLYAMVFIAAGLFMNVFIENAELYFSDYNEMIAGNNDAIISLLYTIPLFPLGFVLRVIAYLVSPFYYGILYEPNSWFASTTNASYLIISIGTLFLVSQYMYLFVGMQRDKLVFFISLLLISGIILTTFGYRHIVMVYPFLITLIYRGKIAAMQTRSYRICQQNSIIVVIAMMSSFLIVFLFV